MFYSVNWLGRVSIVVAVEGVTAICQIGSRIDCFDTGKTLLVSDSPSRNGAVLIGRSLGQDDRR
jgi:hypothetical protein